MVLAAGACRHGDPVASRRLAQGAAPVATRGRDRRCDQPRRLASRVAGVAPRRVGWPLAILAALIFSKYFYLASLTSYYTFF